MSTRNEVIESLFVPLPFWNPLPFSYFDFLFEFCFIFVWFSFHVLFQEAIELPPLFLIYFKKVLSSRYCSGYENWLFIQFSTFQVSVSFLRFQVSVPSVNSFQLPFPARFNFSLKIEKWQNLARSFKNILSNFVKALNRPSPVFSLRAHYFSFKTHTIIYAMKSNRKFQFQPKLKTFSTFNCPTNLSDRIF